MMSDQAVRDAPARAIVRAGTPADARACSAIYNAWIDETPWMPRLHTHDDVVRFIREQVIARQKVLVCESRETVAGYLALGAEDFVTALYVDGRRQRRGVGTRLLDAAKTAAPGGLKLWTFLANNSARRFYEHHGFKEVRRTDGDNEEGLPDILMAWSGGR